MLVLQTTVLLMDLNLCVVCVLCVLCVCVCVCVCVCQSWEQGIISSKVASTLLKKCKPINTTTTMKNTFSELKLILYVIFLLSLDVLGLTMPTYNTSLSRRNLLQSTFPKSLLGSAMISLTLVEKVDALGLCRPKARNCIRTTWEAPGTVNEAQAIETLRDVLNSYPQNGQNGIDCNGWIIVHDSLSSSLTSDEPRTLKLEYRSCVGPAALTINLAQPFVDDVILELDNVGSNNRVTVQVKSSSRMGSSDLFVNRKRIEYLGDELRQKYGWIVPDIKYGAQ